MPAVKGSDMRLTVDQRLGAIERDSIVLHDTIKLLHNLLKDQQHLINDYIVQKIGHIESAEMSEGRRTRPEEAVYTFVCQRRFKRIEKDVRKILKLIEDSNIGKMAG